MSEKKNAVTFYCPKHGHISGTVKYISIDLGSSIFENIAIKYCNACQCYYTPFANLLSLYKIKYLGYEIKATEPHISRGAIRENVVSPRLVDIEEENRRKEKIRLQEEQRILKAERQRKEKQVKYQKYIEGLREIADNALNGVLLSNKFIFQHGNKCPKCNQNLKKERVRITKEQKYLLADVNHCDCCGVDYITPKQYSGLITKAEEVIRGYFPFPFFVPSNMRFEYTESGEYLLIPKRVFDYEKYNHRHLPPRSDDVYEMTEDKFQRVKTFYEPEEFLVNLRKKSILGEAGYSTSENERRRHKILTECVNEYGKSRVLNQLKCNMNLRIKQKDGEVRYEKALNVYRGDIWFVENKL